MTLFSFIFKFFIFQTILFYLPIPVLSLFCHPTPSTSPYTTPILSSERVRPPRGRQQRLSYQLKQDQGTPLPLSRLSRVSLHRAWALRIQWPHQLPIPYNCELPLTGDSCFCGHPLHDFVSHLNVTE